MKPKSPVFKTAAGEASYLEAYERTLALWPVPFEARDVPTEFGSTHVIVSGPEGGQPLLLLPGMATTATMWFSNVADLSRDRRVFALDTLGDIGKSVPTTLPHGPQAWAEWLVAVLDALEIARANVVGLSFGGWLTLTLGLHAPARVRRLVVLAPAGGLVPLRVQFFTTVFPAMLLPIRSLRRRAVLWFAAEGSELAPAFVEQFVRAFEHGRFKLAPTIYSDEELRGLEMPTLLLIGEDEVVFDPEKALARAQALIPDLQTELIPGASHCLPMEQPAQVNARILAFLNEKGA